MQRWCHDLLESFEFAGTVRTLCTISDRVMKRQEQSRRKDMVQICPPFHGYDFLNIFCNQHNRLKVHQKLTTDD